MQIIRSYFFPDWRRVFAFLVLCFVLATFTAYAQDGATLLEGFPLAEVVIALSAAFAPVIVFLVKKIPYDIVPKWLLPFLSTVFGYALTQVAAWGTSVELAWYWSVVLGMATVALREMIDQVAKRLGQPA